MQKRTRLGMMLVLTAVGVLWSAKSSGEGPLDAAKDILYPDFDYKYIQYLTRGHLGQNKPRYGKHQWKVKESRRFWVYVYGAPDEIPDEVANWYLSEAEKTFDEFSKQTGMYAFSDKIRIVVYNSARDFMETNLVSGFVPSGLGGLTELIRWKRMVIAFRNSPQGFRDLLRHELYHRYQTEILKLNLNNIYSKLSKTPLWLAEGSAEHFAHAWDAMAEIFMRDAYLHNNLASPMNKHWYSTGQVYLQGRFVCDFIAERYKDKGEVISALIRACGKAKSFAEAFEQVTGESLEDFSKALSLEIEKRYYHLRVKTDITDQSKSLGNGVVLSADNGFFVTKKRILGRTTLLLNWTDGQKIHTKKLVEDGRLWNESLKGMPFEIEPVFGFQEHGASLTSGNRVVYSIDAGGHDEIRIQGFSLSRDPDPKKTKIILGAAETHRIKGVRDIQYATLINEDQVVFIGRDRAFSEIFLYNRKTNGLQKLTNFRRNCQSLVYSQSLNTLVVSWENDATKSYDLAAGDLGTGEWYWLTETPDNEFYPAFSPDGKKLLYVGDRGLAHNIYLYNFEAKLVQQVTDVKIGVFHPQWLSDKGLIFNSFENASFVIRVAPLPESGSSASSKNPESATKTDDSALIEEFLSYLPKRETLTVMDTVVAPDQTKALVAVNRKLSLETLKRGDAPIKFYLVDRINRSVKSFTVAKIMTLEDYDSPEFLAGTKILFKRYSENRRSWLAGIYDWESRKLWTLENGGLLGVTWKFFDYGKPKNTFLKVSPNREHVLLANDGRIRVFNAVSGKTVYSDKFIDLMDVIFTPDNQLIVAAKDKDGLLNPKTTRFISVNLETQQRTQSAWETVEDFVSWHFVPDKKTLFVVTKEEVGNFNVRILNTENDFLSRVPLDLWVLKGTRVEENDLVMETVNEFSLKKTIRVNLAGETKSSEESRVFSDITATALVSSRSMVHRQTFEVDQNIPKNIRDYSTIPKPYMGLVGGNLSLGQSVVVLGLLALDELDDRAFSLNLYLKQWKNGFVDLGYYDLVSGRSFTLDYWHMDKDRQKFVVGAAQNIFLDRYLNWDIALKEEYWRVSRFRYEANGNATFYVHKSWQTKLQTTFSVDTTIVDPHGPVSGNALFTSAEVGVNSEFKYQSLDLNMEARQYLPFTDRSGLAFRFAGGYGLGPNPTTFVWGGNQVFRGIPLFSQRGNMYWMQSIDLRFPIFDIVGAKISGPADNWIGPVFRYIDVRGGFYGDVGDLWYDRQPIYNNGAHQGFKLQYSVGYFINIPIVYGTGINFRFSKGLFGKKDLNFWLGMNF
ncbi:MAG: hypothetical protein Q8P76_00010 [bacterium]|nr:hypothetical protein [bacterium]